MGVIGLNITHLQGLTISRLRSWTEPCQSHDGKGPQYRTYSGSYKSLDSVLDETVSISWG